MHQREVLLDFRRAYTTQQHACLQVQEVPLFVLSSVDSCTSLRPDCFHSRGVTLSVSRQHCSTLCSKTAPIKTLVSPNGKSRLKSLRRRQRFHCASARFSQSRMRSARQSFAEAGLRVDLLRFATMSIILEIEPAVVTYVFEPAGFM